MSIVIKIGIISLIFVCFSLILKTYRPEYVFLLRICTVLIIFLLILDDLSLLFSNVISIFSVFNIESEHIKLLLKVTGIAIITDCISDILIDSGEKSLAGIVTISSKFIIIYLALPVLNGLIIFCLKYVE